MTWFSPQKLAIFDPIQPRLYGSKVQKWSRTIIPYVWEVFWCNRSLKWAELWSQQPWEWPKRLKSEEKWPQNGQFLSIGIFLWHRNYSHINIYWHPWFGPIFSTFGYLEVSFAHNFFILLRMSWKEPAPFEVRFRFSLLSAHLIVEMCFEGFRHRGKCWDDGFHAFLREILFTETCPLRFLYPIPPCQPLYCLRSVSL